MVRKQPPPKKKDDLPAWFTTYSDVITLLMTFFILLLTFANNEPEMFEQMQISLFGAGGATGLAGEMKQSVENDSYLIRERPPSGRLTMDGSEMPPIHTDPATRGVNKGLAGLDNQEHRDPTRSHQIDIPLTLLVNEAGEVFPRGQQLSSMLSRQLRKDPCFVKFQVSTPAEMPRAIKLALDLIKKYEVRPGKIGVSVMPSDGIPTDQLRLVTYWHEKQAAP